MLKLLVDLVVFLRDTNCDISIQTFLCTLIGNCLFLQNTETSDGKIILKSVLY